MSYKTQHCPGCGSTDVAEILYGIIDRKAYQAEFDTKKVYDGGSIVREEGPHWLCNECKTAWCKTNDDVYQLDEHGEFLLTSS